MSEHTDASSQFNCFSVWMTQELKKSTVTDKMHLLA